MRATVAVVSVLSVVQLASSTGAGADPPPLVAVKAAQPPALDGRAEDAVWKQAKAVTVVAKGVMPKTPRDVRARQPASRSGSASEVTR